MRSSSLLKKCASALIILLLISVVSRVYEISIMQEYDKPKNEKNDHIIFNPVHETNININTKAIVAGPSDNICDIDLRHPTLSDYQHNGFITRAMGRIKLAESFCKDLGYENKTWIEVQPKEGELSNRLIVDDIHQVLYVPTFKGGSTSWGTVFAHILLPQFQQLKHGEILSKINFKYMDSLPYMRPLPMETQEKLLKSYYKFTFVREPFNRLLSAFRDKFMNPQNTYFRQRHVDKMYVHEKSFTTTVSDEDTTAIYRGMKFSFRSFIRYLIHTDPVEYDEHWGLYSVRLVPCWMKYDFIGKLETIEEDFNYLSKCKLHQENYSSIFPPQRAPHADVYFKRFYSTVDKEDLIKLFKIFKLEYVQFGYEIPDIVTEAYKKGDIAIDK